MSEDTQQFKRTTEELIRTIAVQVGRIEVRQEATNEHLSNIDNKLGVQNGRIGKLESWRDKILGAFKLVGAVGLVSGAIYTVVKLVEMT